MKKENLMNTKMKLLPAFVLLGLGGCSRSLANGEEGGRCYGNGTCDDGLVCLRTHVTYLNPFKGSRNDEMCVRIENVRAGGKPIRMVEDVDGGAR